MSDRLLAWARARVADVAVAMMTAMFVVFLLQIFARYFLPFPIGWTVELSSTLWLWLVFWLSALDLRDEDHIRFDTLYLAVGPRKRRIFALISALVVAGTLGASAPATWGYISFLQLQRSAVMEIPLDRVFSIFGLFLVATVLRYLWRAVQILRGRMPGGADPAGQGAAMREAAAIDAAGEAGAGIARADGPHDAGAARPRDDDIPPRERDR